MRLLNRIMVHLIIAALICMVFSGCAKKTISNNQAEEGTEEGKVVVTVTDSGTKKPLSNARVIILGVDNYYKTDELGQSPEITMKINKDFYKKYGDSLLKKAPSGSATILVSKDGYKDYIMFNKAIYPGYSANQVKIQMSKLSKNDKDKFVEDTQYPHDQWIQELVAYCMSIREDKSGEGSNTVSVVVKDQNSKPLEGVSVIIPELQLRTVTDKAGKAVLKPGPSMDISSVYPVKRQVSEYTVVASKEGYFTSVCFNVGSGGGKKASVNIELKKSKSEDGGGYTLNSFPYEKDWVDKIISSYEE